MRQSPISAYSSIGNGTSRIGKSGSAKIEPSFGTAWLTMPVGAWATIGLQQVYNVGAMPAFPLSHRGHLIAVLLQRIWVELQPLWAGRSRPVAITRRAIIAVRYTYASDPKRVFIVGFSAGGGMAAAMLAAYPAVFAAGGVVAGMPVGCAKTSLGAMLHMRRADTSRSRQALADDVGAVTRVAVDGENLRGVTWVKINEAEGRLGNRRSTVERGRHAQDGSWRAPWSRGGQTPSWPRKKSLSRCPRESRGTVGGKAWMKVPRVSSR